MLTLSKNICIIYEQMLETIFINQYTDTTNGHIIPLYRYKYIDISTQYINNLSFLFLNTAFFKQCGQEFYCQTSYVLPRRLRYMTHCLHHMSKCLESLSGSLDHLCIYLHTHFGCLNTLSSNPYILSRHLDWRFSQSVWLSIWHCRYLDIMPSCVQRVFDYVNRSSCCFHAVY